MTKKTLSFSRFAAIRLCAAASVAVFAAAAPAQQAAPAPKIVQPGSPGTASRNLTPEAANELAKPLPPTKADAEFVQGMIMHHGQAVEMTDLLKTRTHDPASASRAAFGSD